MAATPAPLPVELQTKIVNYLVTSKERDIGFLWTSVRNVSKTFRSIVDELVAKKHLKHTSIQYPLDWIYLEEGGKLAMTTEFEFDRISPENPNIAIFKTEVADEYKHHIKDALEGAGVKWDANFYRPPHIVYIRRSANDTELPNYSIDLENFELSCDWKDMFTAFWYEEKFVETLLHRYVEAFGASRTGLPPASPVEMFQRLMGYSNNSDEIRKKVRRSRIARQEARQGEEYYADFIEDEEEKETTERLEMANSRGNFARFSDDERGRER